MQRTKEGRKTRIGKNKVGMVRTLSSVSEFDVKCQIYMKSSSSLLGHDVVIAFVITRQQIIGQQILIGHAIICVLGIEALQHLGGNMVTEVEILLVVRLT